MAQCETKFWSKLDFDENSVIEFPSGIPGFEQEKRFILIEQQALKPLVFLQSLSTPTLCFVAVHAQVVCAGYKLEIPAEDLEALGLPASWKPSIGTEVACLAIVHMEEDAVTANLLAPIVILIAERKGVQVIMASSEYSHQHRLEVAEAPVC
jgi:flagellar assembly factor FliW